MAQLLERTDELARLDELLESGGRLALVRGEAGIGKTSLVRRFCEQQPAGRVLWGACDPLYTPRPLGPFLDVAHATGGELELLARAEPKPYELAAALMRELERPPARIVVVEDMHWADEATLDVLRIVARRLDSLPALFVATYRDDEVDRRHPLRALLGELAVADRAARIPLAPLSPEAVAVLATEHGVDPEGLYRKTNGNPFFVTELLAAGTDLPETLRDAVLARAGHLGPRARAVVDAAAMTPPHTELWLLDALVPEGTEVLDQCLASGMLAEDGDRVSFRHELARLAIESSLPAARRKALHAKALAALAEPPFEEPDAARLAHHAAGAGDVEAVLRFAPVAAARAASVGAHREAAAHYAQALAFGDRLEPARRAELLERRAYSAYMTDQNPEAVDAVREAVAIHHDRGDTLAEASALTSLSNYLWCPGRVAESWEAGRRAVEVLEPLGESPELGLAYGNLAFLARAAADGTSATVWAERALAIADLYDDPEPVVGALAALGEGESLLGLDSGREKIARALEVSRERGFAEVIGWGETLIGHTMLWNREYENVVPLLEAATAYCGGRGFELYRQYDIAYLARAELDRGLWAAGGGPRGDGAAPPPRVHDADDLRPRGDRAPPRATWRPRSVVAARRSGRARRDERRAAAARARRRGSRRGGLARRPGGRDRGAYAAGLRARADATAAVGGRRARVLAPGARARGGGGAVRAHAPGRLGGRRRTMDPDRLPVRGGAGARRRRRGGAARGSCRAPPPRCPGDRGSRRAQAARARCAEPAPRAAALDEGQPGRPDPARGRGAGPGHGGPPERGDRRAALPLGEDDRHPCRLDPAQARRAQPRRGRRWPPSADGLLEGR